MNCPEFKLEQTSSERTIYGTSILSNIVRERELQIHFTNQSEDYQLQVRPQRQHLNCLSFIPALLLINYLRGILFRFSFAQLSAYDFAAFRHRGRHQKCKCSRLSVLDPTAYFFRSKLLKSCLKVQS